MNGEVRVLGPREDERELAPATPVRLDRPPEERLAREKLVAECLAISGAGPQLFTGSASTHGASKKAKKDQTERRVEPDHRVGARPHQIARATTSVIPVDDPRVAFDRASHALPEEILGNWIPVRTPVELVELDVRNAEPTG
jgi:hypothetical protein